MLFPFPTHHFFISFLGTHVIDFYSGLAFPGLSKDEGVGWGGVPPLKNLLCWCLRHETWWERTLVCEGLRNAKHVHQTPEILPTLAFFQWKPCRKTKLEQYKLKFCEMVLKQKGFRFVCLINYFHDDWKNVLTLAKLKIFMLHKPNGFMTWSHCQ